MSKEEKGDNFIDKIKQIDDKVIGKAKELDSKMDKAIASGKKKGKSMLKRLFLAIVIIAILTAIGYYLYAGYVYSEGTRSGELIKVSKKGFPFKTYEGQLKLGGIDMSNAKNGTISDTWDFSVKDENVVEQLEKLQGEEVKLKYEQVMQPLPWQGDTHYFIKEVVKQ